MQEDIERIEESLKNIKSDANDFFDTVDSLNKAKKSKFDDLPIGFKEIDWDDFPDTLRKQSHEIQKLVISTLGGLQKHIKLSSLLTEVDEIDLISCIKSMRASLRLRKYSSWTTEVIHDEGMVRGVSPPGQTDSLRINPDDSRYEFFDNYTKVEDIFDLVKASPASITGNLSDHNRNVPISYRPNTAFLIMRIAPDDDHVQEIYNAYVKCFAKFGIEARRADDIQHDEIITIRVMDEIKNSEYLLGDLTGQRPNVYYEVGFAHALARSVILFKEKDSTVHFDLAGYNCIEYGEISELEEKLIKRLETVTNRKLPE